ncbi:MAG: flotillin family protein [Chloroflexi bacterium]|nr:flotillin family protein [Chloroflexota bacterium]
MIPYTLLIALVAAIVLVLLLIWLASSMWRVAEPNEALILSGLHHRLPEGEVGESLGFKIVTGKGTFKMPLLQQVRRLSLDLNQADLEVDCVTQQGIPLKVKGVVIYKVGDDYASIANAARRFLDQQEMMDQRVHNVFAGNLRAIVGNMTVEEMIRDREKLTGLTREHAGVEIQKLGLIVDSLQIQEIDDPTGYIANLAKPHAAAVMREARIAQAQADQEATEREQAAEALKAQARRDAEIKKAGFQAELDRAAAQAQQAGPLADAIARQEVVVQETKIAQLAAEQKEQQLYADVRKPADAKAYEQVTLARAEGERLKLAAEAEAARTKLSADADATRTRLSASAKAEELKAIGGAEADATRARGMAEAEAARARGLAEAEAIKARADALAEHQDAVIGEQLAEKWPQIVEAAAKPFGNVDQMIVLNGAQGMSELLAQALSQGVSGLALARKLLAGKSEAAPAENGRTEGGATPPSSTPG